MVWFFSNKKEVNRLRDETKKSFDLVKKDIDNVGDWIKHLNSEKEFHKRDLKELKDTLSTIKEELNELKHMAIFAESINYKRVFKTPEKVFDKQTAVYPVQTGVQTGVQTPKLDQFSITERAIIWALLNTDMKLSYEDLAAVLGKEKATIRGQINSIKQKSESILEEIVEKNGKKRVFIPEKVKEKLLKKAKVRVKSNKKGKKNSEK